MDGHVWTLMSAAVAHVKVVFAQMSMDPSSVIAQWVSVLDPTVEPARIRCKDFAMLPIERDNVSTHQSKWSQGNLDIDSDLLDPFIDFIFIDRHVAVARYPFLTW
jgi:hypothetical protein